jgi:hypothetical protein
MLLWPMLELLGGPGAVLSAAVVFAAAAAIWFSVAGSRRGRVVSVALAPALVAFLTYNKRHDLVGVRHAKEHTLVKPMLEKWNSFSRIAIEYDPTNGSNSIRIDADAQNRHRFRSSERRPAPQPARRRTHAALRRPPRRQGADYRPPRRIRRGARSGHGQPRYYGGRDQPHHRRNHHEV